MKKIIMLLLAFTFVGISAIYAQIDFTVLNKTVTYATTFDSLSAKGVSNRLPSGFALYQSNGAYTYSADAGDSIRANIYSYGAANAILGRVRALGSISSKADTCYYGIEFQNNTGYAINSLTIAYTIEQWHLGAIGRGADTTEFDFSTNASSVTGTGKWTHYSALDMISPVTKGVPGALNGQLPANQSKVSYKMTGLNISNGSTFWIRWYDHVIPGPNDGLGVQALTLNAYSDIAGPTVVTKIANGKFPQTAGMPDTTVYGKFHGIVLSPDFVSGTGLQFSIRDSLQTTGPQAGIGAITSISTTGLNGYKPNIGDSIYVTGKIRSYKYLTYIEMDTLKLIKANAHPNPVSIIANAINDYNESNLITLNNLTMSPTAIWDTTGASALGGFTTTARTGAGANVTIFINKNSNIFLRRKPNFPFNLTGIALQSGTTPTTGYFIWPRFAADFDTLPTPKVPLKNIGDINAFRTNNIPQIYGLADSTNKPYFVKGVVHSPNLYDGGLYFNLIDNTGAITVYNVAPIDGYTPKIGDSILVEGIVQQLNGLIVIAADSIRLLNSGAKLTAPQFTSKPITKAQESYLITIKGARIVGPKAWDSTKIASYNMFEVRIVAGLDTFFMDIPKTTDLFRKPPILGAFNVTGVVGEYSTNAKIPYNDHYEIIPRGSFDIVQTKIPTYTIGQIKPYNPTTGAADSLGVTCFTKGVVQSGNLTDTGFTAFAIADNTGAIIVANVNKLSAYSPTIGDSIILMGTVNQSGGLTVFVPDSIYVQNSGNKILSPVILTKLIENEESALITIQAYAMVDPNEWDNSLPANKYGFNVHFYKGIDTVIVHISDNVPSLYNLPYAQKPLGFVDITGIELQKTTAKAPFANYYIEPGMLSDINTNSGIETISCSKNDIKIYPNPAHDNVGITSGSTIEKLTLSDMEGKQWITLINPGSVNITLDMSPLKPGIYILQINSGAGIFVQKLIRQ